MKRNTFTAAITVLLLAASARAEDKCQVKGSFGGKSISLKSCAVAFYGEKSVTIWFTEAPLSAGELETFQLSSAPKNKDPQNNRRTMLSLAFCAPKAAPAAIKEVSVDASHSSSPMLSQSWVVDLAADKTVKFASLAGDVKRGGRLSGKVTGSKKEQGQAYTWEADFDVQVPQKQAGAGLSCN